MRISDWSSDVCSSDLEDGAADSDNVLGDVVEALIVALYLEGGIEPACAFIRRAWEDRVHTHAREPQHPKSSLQEWTAAHNRKPPAYEIVERAGPHHAPRFTVNVSINKLAESTATGTSKLEAETAAAESLLEKSS